MANIRGWPEADRVEMLQALLTGKGQEAYSALTASDSLKYATVKEVIFKAYEF